MKNKIAVLGEKNSVLGFTALGADVFFDVLDFDKITSANAPYAILYIMESFALELGNKIEDKSEDMLPAIILIPGPEGSLGFGMKSVKKSVERAVGADILFANEED